MSVNKGGRPPKYGFGTLKKGEVRQFRSISPDLAKRVEWAARQYAWRSGWKLSCYPKKSKKGDKVTLEVIRRS